MAFCGTRRNLTPRRASASNLGQKVELLWGVGKIPSLGTPQRQRRYPVGGVSVNDLDRRLRPPGRPDYGTSYRSTLELFMSVTQRVVPERDSPAFAVFSVPM